MFSFYFHLKNSGCVAWRFRTPKKWDMASCDLPYSFSEVYNKRSNQNAMRCNAAKSKNKEQFHKSGTRLNKNEDAMKVCGRRQDTHINNCRLLLQYQLLLLELILWQTTLYAKQTEVEKEAFKKWNYRNSRIFKIAKVCYICVTISIVFETYRFFNALNKPNSSRS